MRRILALLAVTVAMVTPFALSAGPASAVQSCSDSWGSDGHTGPWFVGTTQTLHGNTVVVSCPSGGTSWSVNYQVIKCDPNFPFNCFSPIDVNRSGSGSTSFSISASPVGCNQGWPYKTRVHNVVTGGNISKPPNGEVIC